jgi:(2Fe-2S) ferredoxin
VKYPRKLFLVCTGPRCNNEERGEERGEFIRADMKALNKELGRKPTVRICATSCLDLCEEGPNMIGPDGDVFSHLTRKEAIEIYHEVTDEG